MLVPRVGVRVRMRVALLLVLLVLLLTLRHPPELLLRVLPVGDGVLLALREGEAKLPSMLREPGEQKFLLTYVGMDKMENKST